MLTDSQRWMLIIFGTCLVGLVYLLGPVLIPFEVSAILAYLFNPLVDKIQRQRVPRVIAVLVIFVLLFLLLLLMIITIVPRIQAQIEYLLELIPAVLDRIQLEFLPWLSQHTSLIAVIDIEQVKMGLMEHWKEAGAVIAKLIRAVSSSGRLVMSFLSTIILISVVTFYLMRDWHSLLKGIRRILPRSIEPKVIELIEESDQVLSAFMRGQFMMMCSLGFIYWLGLWIVGLEVALIIAVLAGLMSIVPYLGTIMGVLIASVAAIMQFQDTTHLIYVLILFGLGNIIEGMVLTPWLIGDRIGLHPVAVIFAILAGGQLFGFNGVLLALPVASVMMILIRDAYQRYENSYLYDVGNR